MEIQVSVGQPGATAELEKYAAARSEPWQFGAVILEWAFEQSSCWFYGRLLNSKFVPSERSKKA